MSDPDPEIAEERIRACMDSKGDEYLYGFALAGEDANAWYYITVFEREYEGNMYLNERYVQLVKPDSEYEEDTFHKNGINRRAGSATGEMARSLAKMYHAIANLEEMYEAGDIGPDEMVDREPDYYDVR
jgi:hypothetical protein